MEFNTFGLTCQFAQIKEKMKLPLNLSIRGVQKVYVCLHKDSTRDAYDKINHFSTKKKNMTLSGADWSDRSAPDSQPNTAFHHPNASH